MVMYGADVDELRGLASQFNSAGQAIDIKALQLNMMLATTPWKGRDANAFRSEWNSQHRRQLQQVKQALVDAARDLQRNADEQEGASKAVGGGLAGLLNGIGRWMDNLPLIGPLASGLSNRATDLGRALAEALRIIVPEGMQPGPSDSSPWPLAPNQDPGFAIPDAPAPAPSAPVVPGASDNGQRAADYVARWQGKAHDSDGNGVWCFDVFRQYSNDLGAPASIGITSNAASDLYRHYEQNGCAQYYDRIPHGSGSPQPGDIIVYDNKYPYDAQYGHVGLVSTIQPDGQMKVFEQNWNGPEGKLVDRNSNGPAILGYLRPK